MKQKIIVTLVTLAAGATAVAQMAGRRDGNELLREADRIAADPEASPIRRIERQAPTPPPVDEAPIGFRRFDGRDNNLGQPDMGSAHVHLSRWIAADYADGLSAPAGVQRPLVREVSNIVADQEGDLPNPMGVSDFLWQWGQFLDHDIDLTDGMDPPESWPIVVSAGDAWFNPSGTG